MNLSKRRPCVLVDKADFGSMVKRPGLPARFSSVFFSQFQLVNVDLNIGSDRQLPDPYRGKLFCKGRYSNTDACQVHSS